MNQDNNNENSLNEREELLRTFNDTIEEKKTETVAPYRATTNFNTALSNPNMSVGNKMDVNINSDNGINNTMSMNDILSNPVVETPKEESPVVDSQIPSMTPTNMTPTEPVNVPDTTDVTERFYEETPVYDMQHENTVTYISNNEVPQQKKEKLKMSKETYVFIIMVLLLFIFILVLPVISKVIRGY